MILHILSDDKFTDYAIRQFSMPEMLSDIVVCEDSKAIKFVKETDTVKFIAPYSTEFAELIREIKNYKSVVFHGLFYPWMEDIINSCPKDVKVAWVFWGGEIYGRNDLLKRFLDRKSNILFCLHDLKIKWRRKDSKNNSYEMPMSCFQRVDYCLCDVAEEKSFLKEYIGKDFQFRWYNYYSVEETIGKELMQRVCDGNNVLVGNSSSIECNHIESLLALKRMGYDKGEIIVPLNYGSSWLKNAICKIGVLLFGSKFHPLKEFMPREDYNKLIASCSVVIMNHWRQQAFGNIVTALWLGSRVYLSKRSPLFAYFKRIGCVLFSVEDDLTRKKIKWNPLSDIEIEQNRKAIYAEYNKEIMHKRNIELVKELNA